MSETRTNEKDCPRCEDPMVSREIDWYCPECQVSVVKPTHDSNNKDLLTRLKSLEARMFEDDMKTIRQARYLIERLLKAQLETI